MTAVEWLEEIYLQTNKIDNFDLEVAKEMEKQQIIDARVKIILDSNYVEAEQYYNETFNK